MIYQPHHYKSIQRHQPFFFPTNSSHYSSPHSQETETNRQLPLHFNFSINPSQSESNHHLHHTRHHQFFQIYPSFHVFPITVADKPILYFTTTKVTFYDRDFTAYNMSMPLKGRKESILVFYTVKNVILRQIFKNCGRKYYFREIIHRPSIFSNILKTHNFFFLEST